MPVDVRRLSIGRPAYRYPEWIGSTWIYNQHLMLDGDPNTFGTIVFFHEGFYPSGSFLAISPIYIEIPLWENKLWFYEVGIKIGNIDTSYGSYDSINTLLESWEVFFAGATNIVVPIQTYMPTRIYTEDLLFTTVCLKDYNNRNIVPFFEVFETSFSIFPPITSFTSPQNTTVKLTMNTQVIDKSVLDTTANFPLPQHSLGSESAFGMLFPRSTTLNVIPSIKIIIYFVFHCIPLVLGYLSRPLFSVKIYDIYVKVPSPTGDVYIWNENTGLSFVNSGGHTPIYDKDLSTYIQTSSSTPRRGILTVFPFRIQVPETPLRVYAKSPGGTPQTISYYTGVDTVPPSGSPTTQITVSDPGWYTLLTDSLVDWSYFII